MAISDLLAAAVIITTVTVLSIVVVLKSSPETTISLNVAKHKTAFYFLAIGISLALALSSLWYNQWFAPVYSLQLLSHAFFSVIVSSFLIAVWIPDVAGRRRKIHRLAAYIAVLTMPLFLLTIAPSLPYLIYSYALFATVLLQAAMVYLLFFVPVARKYFLPLQGVYLASFFVVLLTLTYSVRI